ncbi:MAG: dicarboxylate/amino acid:cation symporter [Gudongella sp.]|nr:dicarboxylate/amino acid:cation symporter [Gudongella sp.]
MSNSINRNSLWKNYRFPLLLLTGIIVGSIIGIVFGEKAKVLSPLGDLFINMMFTAVIPLVFLSISSAVGNMMNMKRLGKILGSMFSVFMVTGAIAAVIIIFVVKIFPPAEGVNIVMEAASLEKISVGDALVNAFTVSDFPLLLSRSHMLALIVFSILFGFCVSAVGGEDNKIAQALDMLNKVMMKMISIIMYYAPIGLGAYFAALVAEYGPQLLGAYLRSMAVYYPLCIAYFFVAFAAYSYWAGGIEGTKIFFKNIITPAVTSLATCSSIATLPVNFAATEKMNVPKDIREIVLPIGATMHMDGTALSSILKISFLFGIFGMEFAGLGTYVTAVLISVLGGVVMSGVPGGGLIGEMLIVTIYGFPPEAFPIVATIGFLVDPPATMINASGDAVAAMMVTRIVEGENWLTQKISGTVSTEV